MRPHAYRGLVVEESFGYSQATAADGFVYVAGQVGRDAEGIVPEPLTFRSSLSAALDNVVWALEEAGAGADDLVAVQTFAAVPLERCWEELAELHRERLGAGRPAATVIEVDRLNQPTYFVEVSAVAKGEEMERQDIAGGDLEAQLGASRAVRVGRHVFLGGQLPAEPHGDAVDQLGAALETLRASLAAVGGTLADVVATHLFLTERPEGKDSERMLEVHSSAFPGPSRPTATLVYVPALPHGAKAQVSATAVVGSGAAE